MRANDDTHEPSFTLEADSDVAAQVRDDIVSGLSTWFENHPDGFRLRNDLHEHGDISNGRVTAVVWRYETTARRDPWGVAAGRTVFVHGTTFVDGSDGTPRFSRYIDWHGVFGDLGVAAAGHIVREPT